MWRGIAMVCVCTICCMLPLAAPTVHHGKGLISCLGCTQGGGAPQGGGGNPANDLVARVNADRASAKLPTLRNSKGLGCMALQYISRCSDKGQSGCAANRTLAPPCRPPETDITEVYAADCGVELPTVGVISGRILGCSLDMNGDDLFYIANATEFRGKEDAVVGKGFWCLLLSSGSPNSSFLLEDAGRGIAQAQIHGCFSDPDVGAESLNLSSSSRCCLSQLTEETQEQWRHKIFGDELFHTA